jgi:hypothetical protein
MTSIERGIIAALRKAGVRKGSVAAERLAVDALAIEPRMRTPIPGAPRSASDASGRYYSTAPDPRLRAISERYAKNAGIDYIPPPDFAKIDPEAALSYARAYDEMPDDLADPLVQASWKKMGAETLDQLQAMLDDGYRFEFMPQNRAGEFVDPYAASPRGALEDLRDNKRMFVFPTAGGYGTLNDADVSNPNLRRVHGLGRNAFRGEPFVVNDAFRAVHDALGHGPMGAGFRAGGEENAFRHHAALYSDLARPAVAAETRGQNSWVNFIDRPHPDVPGKTIGQVNRKASAIDTVYADQKAGIMPDDVYNRGLEWLGRPVSIEELRKMIAKGGAMGALATLVLYGEKPSAGEA